MDLDEDITAEHGSVPPQPEVMQPPQRAASTPGGSGSLPAIRENREEHHQLPVPDLIHSTSSETSESASGIAKGGQLEWDLCMQRNDCQLQALTVPGGSEKVKNLLNDIKFPYVAVKDKKFVEWVTRMLAKRASRVQPLRVNINSYVGWIRLLDEDKVELGDPYELEDWRECLYAAWDSHKTSCDFKGLEAEIRRGVDTLIEIAFQLRHASKHMYRAERDLFLPSSPTTSTPDAVTFMRLPVDWVMFLTGLSNHYIFAADADLQLMNVVTFLFEAKVSETIAARRQLTLDMCSGQNQRRALGFDDDCLYGATLVGNDFTIYVSQWINDKVSVHPTGIDFRLEDFDDFLECYIFLCKLSDHIAEGLNRIFDKWNDEASREEIKNKNDAANKRHPWRLRERSRAPSERSKSKSKSKKWPRTDGGGSRKDEEFDSSSELDEDEDGRIVMEADYESERIPPGGLPLVEANLRTLDRTVHNMNISGDPPAKDIRGWARQSASSVIA